MKKNILNKRNLHITTKAIHAGCEPDKETGAIIPPIFQTSTYVQEAPGVHRGYEYTRSHNPTRTRLEENLASLEGGEFAIATSSGMSAITLIMHSLPKGSKILCGADVYGGTYRLFTKVFSDYHQFKFTDTSNNKLIEETIKEFKPDLIWLETPSNPLLILTDLKFIKKVADKVGAKICVDNTFLGPYFQRPLEFGVDYVIHSMTKFLNGHSDVVGGCIILKSKELHEKLWFLQNAIGPSQSPFDSWLVLRGLKTYGVRMRAHEENAFKIAKILEASSKVKKVIYPGLKSHPQHLLAKKQMTGFGSMISFYVNGLKEAKKFLKALEVFSLAESLGGVESLVEHPGIMTHASIPKAHRDSIGLGDNLIRLSVGLEDINDLVFDIESALKQI